MKLSVWFCARSEVSISNLYWTSKLGFCVIISLVCVLMLVRAAEAFVVVLLLLLLIRLSSGCLFFFFRICGFIFPRTRSSMTLVLKVHLYGMKPIFRMLSGDLRVPGLLLWTIIHRRYKIETWKCLLLVIPGNLHSFSKKG